jgi:hypothetical protein
VTAIVASRTLLFEVCVDYVDQFLGGDDARIVARCARVQHMLANVIFDHFGDEAIESASTGSRLLQNPGTLEIGLDRSLNGVDLTAQALEAIQQLAFFLCNMTHARILKMAISSS